MTPEPAISLGVRWSYPQPLRHTMPRVAARIIQRDAAMLLGVAVSTVPKLIERGDLTSYGHRPGGCLDLAEVEALVAERELARKRRVEARAKGRVRRRVWPPDADHSWLTVAQAAELVGITRGAMRVRCLHDAVPHTWAYGQRWIRRDLLEVMEHARAAQRSRDP